MQTQADVVLANLYADAWETLAGGFFPIYEGDGMPSNPFDSSSIGSAGGSGGFEIMGGGSTVVGMMPAHGDVIFEGPTFTMLTVQPLDLNGNLFMWSCAMPISSAIRCVPLPP